MIHKGKISDKSMDFRSMMLSATLNSTVSSITIGAVVDLLKHCSCKILHNHLTVEELFTKDSCAISSNR